VRCAQCGGPIVPAVRGRPRRYCGRACQARAYRARRDGSASRSPSRPAPPPHPSELSRARVVRAAIRLADADGIEAVSMRVLAARLGVATMALYRYVSGKDDLVEAMVDTLLAESWEPGDQGWGWRVFLEHEARQEGERYRRHPWLVAILSTARPPLGPARVSLRRGSPRHSRRRDTPPAGCWAAGRWCSGCCSLRWRWRCVG
jgi:AcrR family transcriptional regulator